MKKLYKMLPKDFIPSLIFLIGMFLMLFILLWVNAIVKGTV